MILSDITVNHNIKNRLQLIFVSQNIFSQLQPKTSKIHVPFTFIDVSSVYDTLKSRECLESHSHGFNHRLKVSNSHCETAVKKRFSWRADEDIHTEPSKSYKTCTAGLVNVELVRFAVICSLSISTAFLLCHALIKISLKSGDSKLT